MSTFQPIEDHPVESHADWTKARLDLLAEEKEFSRMRENLARRRRALPWERVEKPYTFAGPTGTVSLAKLFGEASQLIIYHFMFSPDDDEGCPHCSFWADNFDGIQLHLLQRDVSFAAVSRAPWSKIDPFKRRMGWAFTWVSGGDSDFNYDFNVSFTPEQLTSGEAVYNYRKDNPGMPDREGISTFYKDGTGNLFHTYSTFARGIDMVNGAYQFLDLVPRGRAETGHDDPQYWVRHHDRYGS